MSVSSFHDEPWYRAAEAERARFRALRRRSAEIRERAGAAGRDLDAVLAEARRILATSLAERSARAMPPPNQVPGRSTVSRVLRGIGVREEDLPDLLDGLIAAYQDAVAADDRPAIVTLGRILRSIGRDLADELGPRRAGVILN